MCVIIIYEAFSGSKPTCRIQQENARQEAVSWVLIIPDTRIDSVRAPECFHTQLYVKYIVEKR